MRTNIFDKVSFLSIFLVIILLPLFFLPWSNISVEVSKGLLLVAGLAVSIISWGLARFFDGTIVFPRSRMLAAGGGIVLAFLLSALFLKSKQVSLFGTIFDIGTFWFMLAGFLLMLMSSIIFRDQKKAKIVLFGAILSGAVVMIFQIFHLFAPEFLSLGVLSGKTGNLVGSWNALGIFAGLSALTSLLVVEFFSTTKIEKLVLQILAVISMVVIAAVNYPLVWKLLGISALIIFVYKVSLSSKEKVNEADSAAQKVYFPVFSFAIILVSLLFIMSGTFIGSFLPDRLGVQNNEVSPLFGATMGVTGSVLKENPVFGVGPNKFNAAWAMYKPLSVNTDPNCYGCWDISFSSGSGLLPTFAATTGILGIIALLVFFILFILSGVRSIFSSIRHGADWETMAFFVLSFYLFVAAFFYSGGAVIFLLALAFAGAFIGLSSSTNPRGEVSISYLNDHRRSFFSILFLVLILIATAALTFTYLERLVSVSYFSKAVTATEIPEAEVSIGRALALHQNDLYLRTFAQIYLLKLESLVSKDQTSATDEDKALLQSNLDRAVSGAGAAVAYDETNYLNHLALASVYQRLSAYGVKDAYDKAIEAYTKASTLNPNNPGIKLAMATASFNAKKNEEARNYANAALVLKPDYIDAYIVLSQIAKSEGKNALALEHAQKALALAPANAELIKYVDSLKGGGPAPAPTTQ
ncbi:tetratricopeptide repeat protein [Candidatus Nomurabacteria bacterium]|nr:tetratricopeptide repeat protein [Candidatus Nomurabacteria bacterium]